MPKMVPAKAKLSGLDEERRFHGIPPLKRFKLLQKESKTNEGNDIIFCLPAKKRIWAVKDFMFEQEKAREEEEEALLKPPTWEEVEKIACEWSNTKRRRSQKARQKNSDDAQEKRKLKNAEKMPPPCKKLEEQVRLPGDDNDIDDDDDGVVCSVCSGHDGNPSDPIVFCDGCDLMVHATCYGDPLIKGVPEGDWFCARCIHSARSVCCCLCPSSKGAMKCTTQNSWAHISCALLVPEVFFQCPEGRERIDCSKVPLRRWGMLCTFCNMSRGACIECSEHRCPSTFHVSCGLDRDLHIEYRESKAGGIVVGFCDAHTPKWQTQQEGKFMIVPREPAESGKRRRDICDTDDKNVF